jgi:putative isomerase
MSDPHALRRKWLAGLGAGRDARDRKLLERASRTLVDNIVPDSPSLPWHPLRGICPSHRNYKGIWNWDAAFHALAVSRWDRGLAEEQVRIFLDSQKPDGAFVDVLLCDGRVNEDFSKPPVFPWAYQQVHQRAGGDDFLRMAYPRFQAMAGFWEGTRGGKRDVLFHYGGKKPRFESGWDTSVRWDAYRKRMGQLWPIDLNCYMVMVYRALQYMAGVVGDDAGCRRCKEREAALIELINERLWDGSRSCYADVGRDGTPSQVLSPASFMPLFIGIASRARARAAAKLAADPRRFFPGMPTVSYDDPKYRSALYWRGPAWLNVTWFAIRGLERHGETALAARLRETILGWCARNEDCLHEYYDSRTGAGLGAPGFGWTSAFVIELILGE